MVSLTKSPPARSQPATKPAFTGVKVFSASMFTQRQQLGETVTEWLAANPELSIVGWSRRSRRTARITA